MGQSRQEEVFFPTWRTGGQWRYIAEIDGMDRRAIERVDAVLRDHHIPGGSEGSKIYYVFVPTGREREVTALLKSDADDYGYWIMVYLLELGGREYIPVARLETDQVARMAMVFRDRGWQVICSQCPDDAPVYATYEVTPLVVDWLRADNKDSGRYLAILYDAEQSATAARPRD